MNSWIWYFVGFLSGAAFVFFFVLWLLSPLFDVVRAFGSVWLRRLGL
jgi:hypothetical protein